MTATSTLTDPTPAAARYELIDIVRGFALFGVLVANMIWTTQWEGMTNAQRLALPTSAVDTWAIRFAAVFIDYKFYTIFSMLFGLGFALQLSRAESRGQYMLPRYARRLMILFLIGIAHTTLIWIGDILHIYALLGFMLIMVRQWSDRSLIWTALVIALLASLMPFLLWVASTMGLMSPAPDYDAPHHATISGGNLIAIWKMNIDFLIMDYTNPSNVRWYLSILWKFLIGMVIGRRMLLQEPERFANFFRRLLPWALVVGVSVNVAAVAARRLFDVWVPDGDSPFSILTAVVDLGIFSLSAAYVCILTLIFTSPHARRWIMPLAPLGRMALTNYLLQSVMLVVLFYGIGFGLGGKAGATICLLIGIVQYAAQIAISAWWLKRFRFGPMEWLWRSLTYGKAQPMRITPASNNAGP